MESEDGIEVDSLSSEEEMGEDGTEDEIGDGEGNADQGTWTIIPNLVKLKEGVTFRSYDSNSLLLQVLPGAEFHFSGKCEIEMLTGVINICGRYFSPYEERQVFSPKGYSLLSIQGLRRRAGSKESTPRFLRNHIPELKEEDVAGLPGALFLMRGFESNWCKGMRKYALGGKATLGIEMSGIDPSKVPKKKFFGHKLGFRFQATDRVRKARFYLQPPSWELHFPCLAYLEKNENKLAIFGGKGVGKSAFARWVVNRWLEKSKTVLYIDLDPGQGEFTPPGVISVVEVTEPLLGPNFTHLKQTLVSFYLGTVNVMECPLSYMRALVAIQEFVDERRRHKPYQHEPCIINTMGLTQGMGFDIATEIIRLFKPTNVVQISTESARRNFGCDLDYKTLLHYKSCFGKEEPITTPPIPLLEYKLCKLESACGNDSAESQEDQWGVSASAGRNNVMVSYFVNQIGTEGNANLLDVKPIIIPLSKVAIGESCGLPLLPADIVRSMEFNLVALCNTPQDLIQPVQVSDNLSQMVVRCNSTSNGLRKFLGYGFVRAYDNSTRVLYIITPIPVDILQAQLNSVITAGGIGLPLQFCETNSNSSNLVSENGTPYVMNTRESTSKLHMASRKNFVPKVVTHVVLQNAVL